ncbi:L-fucose:H+ symporter permease [Filimonas effusa]|uniref:L-fucose:H+ symporter permease n=1 Tax=Filimonas effusa TaxID=2508721 RepID=A0A4Q1DBI9_9BACT|nr:L-fucose:H+ symporter permease [Filimonas effusa]RXK86834.1 L-fucose:H+ symporter permease [Filimonas effusa]
MDKVKFTEKRFIIVFIFVTSLFMFWGIAHSMSDVLNKHFQNVLKVSKSQSGLIQLSVFGAYFVMSIPAGLFMKKYGYKMGVLLGLTLFALGTFLFVPAAQAASFSYFRLALFILGCGMATLETVAHPFAASLGDQRASDQRVNFAQSFNAVGAIIGPAIGSYFLFGSGTHAAGGDILDSVKSLYCSIGICIALVALAFAFVKIPALTNPHAATASADAVNVDTKPGKKLFQHRHFVWAVLAQLFNVAAQAGTWSYFINYGHEKMGFTDEKAANFMVLFMAMMAAGRFIGTYLMRFIAPNKLLAAFATGSIIACIIVAQAWGWFSYGALFSINFFFSIMFPTIFSLGLKNLGKHTQQASSFISMGVVGGAFFPMIMGTVANHDIAKAYYLPIICYFVIFLFAAKFYKVK